VVSVWHNVELNRTAAEVLVQGGRIFNVTVENLTIPSWEAVRALAEKRG